MTPDTHLDGNALGGLLFDVFSREMTDQLGCCDECGSVNAFGSLIVYRDAPGDVARCPVCQAVIMVAVSLPTGLRVSFGSIRWMEIANA